MDPEEAMSVTCPYCRAVFPYSPSQDDKEVACSHGARLVFHNEAEECPICTHKVTTMVELPCPGKHTLCSNDFVEINGKRGEDARHSLQCWINDWESHRPPSPNLDERLEQFRQVQYVPDVLARMQGVPGMSNFGDVFGGDDNEQQNEIDYYSGDDADELPPLVDAERRLGSRHDSDGDGDNGGLSPQMRVPRRRIASGHSSSGGGDDDDGGPPPLLPRGGGDSSSETSSDDESLPQRREINNRGPGGGNNSNNTSRCHPDSSSNNDSNAPPPVRSPGRGESDSRSGDCDGMPPLVQIRGRPSASNRQQQNLNRRSNAPVARQAPTDDDSDGPPPLLNPGNDFDSDEESSTASVPGLDNHGDDTDMDSSDGDEAPRLASPHDAPRRAPPQHPRRALAPATPPRPPTPAPEPSSPEDLARFRIIYLDEYASAMNMRTAHIKRELRQLGDPNVNTYRERVELFQALARGRAKRVMPTIVWPDKYHWDPLWTRYRELNSFRMQSPLWTRLSAEFLP